MDKFKQGGEFTVDLGRDLVGHLVRVLDGVEPVVLGHLFLGHVRSSHHTDCGPCTFGHPVGGLAPGRGTNDLGLRTINQAAGITLQEFLVVVTAELFGERVSISAKLLHGLNDALGHEIIHAAEPYVIGGVVDEKDSVVVTQLADGVAKNNVLVDLAEVVVGGSEGFAVGLLV